MKVRIIGLGVMRDVDTCALSGKRASGYVDVGDGELTPCALTLLGPGPIGSMVDVPPEYHPTLLRLSQAASNEEET